MSENGLKARQKTRFKTTTDSDHDGSGSCVGRIFCTTPVSTLVENAPVASTVLDQDFAADGPDQKWGVMPAACCPHDISYVWTAEGWLYLAIVLDLFSRRIVGWHLSDRMQRGVVPRTPSAQIRLARFRHDAMDALRRWSKTGPSSDVDQHPG